MNNVVKQLSVAVAIFLFSIYNLCAASQIQKPTSAYPDFSWDRLSVCLHFSNASVDFTPSEVEFMARFPLICIEKNQALKQHSSMEYGTLAAARALKAVNPNTTVLFYFNSCMDYGNMYEHGRILADDRHPEWAIRDVNGDFVLVRNIPERRIYDYSQGDFRDWWVSIVLKWTSYDEIDGVFIDALPKYASTPEARKKSWGEQRYNDIYDGLHTTLDSLKTLFDGKKLMVANFLRGNKSQMEDMGVHFHGYTDGAMMEHFNFLAGANTEHLANDIALIQDAARRNKVVVVKAWPSFNFIDKSKYADKSQDEREALARQDIIFPLVCYLVGAGEFSYFCYSWGYRHDEGGLVDYEEYNRPLGVPKGDAVRDGWIYTREFEHASVWVDIDRKEARIEWR
ncbi:MAG: putative glycoside hydrolase [Rikenellaceae bacterium]